MQAIAQSSSLRLNDWEDPRWRLSNLYWIQNERGQRVKFQPYPAQIQFLNEYWYLNVILKARQRGFTTLIDLMALDQCLFNDNYAAGIVAHNLEDAQKIFRLKVRYPYDNLPLGLRNARQFTERTQSKLMFDNDSSIVVGVSMRSGTNQFLHISEFGKICNKYPEKAREIVTGSLNAVHAGQFVFVESTAEGRGGYFYEMCQEAQRMRAKVKNGSAKLTSLDFKMHFFPWHDDARYRIDPEGVTIGAEDKKYFAKLTNGTGIKLGADQKAWYVKKKLLQKEDMKREYPSTEKEAFEVAVRGAYYGDEMQAARNQGRITNIPYMKGVPVDTFWDLGLSKSSGTTALWCGQYVSMQMRWLKCFEGHSQSLDHYVRLLLDTGYMFGRHFLPHDAYARRLGKDNIKSWKKMLEDLLPGHTFIKVPRISDISIGINQTKARFEEACFDEEGCADGITALDTYQRLWDEDSGAFANSPLHNGASNYADAFRQWGQGWAMAESGMLIPNNPEDAWSPHDETMGM